MSLVRLFKRFLGTKLHRAIESENVGRAQQLLRWGACTEARDQDGYTPLMQAASQASLPLVRLLLDHGATLDACSAFGETALAMACHARKLGDEPAEAVRLLISRGARIDTQDGDGYTPLMRAAMWAAPSLVSVLLAAGAEPARGKRGKYGRTALSIAVEGARADIVVLLVDAGADVACRNEFGVVPLQFAVDRWRYELTMVKALLNPENVDCYTDRDLDRAMENASHENKSIITDYIRHCRDHKLLAETMARLTEGEASPSSASMAYGLKL